MASEPPPVRLRLLPAPHLLFALLPRLLVLLVLREHELRRRGAQGREWRGLRLKVKAEVHPSRRRRFPLDDRGLTLRMAEDSAAWVAESRWPFLLSVALIPA